MPWTAASAFVLLLASVTPPPAEPTANEERCALQAGSRHAVERIIDAETIALDDGTEVRLVGALAPRRLKRSKTSSRWKPEDDAIAALKDLILGRSVELAFPDRRRDRYGRLLAHVFFEREGKRVWVQGEMLSSGHARAYGLPGNFACMRELLAHEAVARANESGLWSNAAYDVRKASQPRQVLRLRNTYQIVEGTVADVAEKRSATHLNFGVDWKTDFTATVSGKARRAHPQWAETLSALRNRRVRVRGWITYRNGPHIDVRDPSQIEIVDDDIRRSPERSKGPTMSRGNRGSEPRVPKKNRPAQFEPGGVDL